MQINKLTSAISFRKNDKIIDFNKYNKKNNYFGYDTEFLNKEEQRIHTLEFVSKLNGKTYLANKIALNTSDGKRIEGMYVYEKNAEADEDGNIKGMFMGYDAFLKKLANELPPINSDTMSAYYPNINKH